MFARREMALFARSGTAEQRQTTFPPLRRALLQSEKASGCRSHFTDASRISDALHRLRRMRRSRARGKRPSIFLRARRR